MRIALCISGGLRNFKDTFFTFEDFILNRPERFPEDTVDVFFYGVENNEGVEQNKTDLVNLYKPKLYQINPTAFYNHIPFNFVGPSGATVYNSFFNILQCNELKRQYEMLYNFKYDLVIRSRVDLFWYRDIEPEEVELAKSYVLTPAKWAFKEVHPDAESELFAIGSSELMDRYSTMFLHVHEYCKTLSFHAETLCGTHLKTHNIPYKAIKEHQAFEYPCQQLEYHIAPYKWKKYFEPPHPNMTNEQLAHYMCNKRRQF